MSTTTERPDELIEILEGDLLSRNDKINRWGNAISSFQNIPGLVGFWPMSSVQRSTGNAFDLTSQGRTLTYNGNPTYNIYNDFMPYIDFDGTGDFLSRADETDLDIIGTETIYTSGVRGLTLGGWFWLDALGTNEGLIGKWEPYAIQKLAAGDEIRMLIDNGVSNQNASLIVPGAGQWMFVIGTWVPSTSITIFINGSTATNTTAIHASISNTANAFHIGQLSAGVQLMNGRAALCFLSANSISDSLVNALFQQSRILFRV